MAEIKRLKKPFSGGLIDDVGVHNFPVSYSSKLRNVRIVNDSLVVAPGYYSVHDGEVSSRIQDMESADGKLFAVYDDELWEIDLTDGSATQRSGSSLPTGARVRILNFGTYIILLTGVGYPFLWNITTSTWSQLTSSNIESTAHPRFGENYLHLTFVAGGETQKKRLYISRGITSANPEYAYDWTGAGSEKIDLDSELISIKATEQRLYVFTEKTIAFLDESTLASTAIAGQTFSYPKQVSKYNAPASFEAVVAAHDRLFVFTKSKDVIEVNRAGVNDLEVTNLSDREGRSIRGFMDKLDADQSLCHGYFNSDENLIVFDVKTDGSPHNNIQLAYDLNYDVFLVNDNKFFGASTIHDGKLYTGSVTSAIIYREGEFRDYDGDTIPRERVIKTNMGMPDMRGMLTDLGIAGQHSTLSTIYIDVSVDGELVGPPFVIAGESVMSGGISTFPIASKPIAGEIEQVGLKEFMKTISQGDLRAKGYIVEIKLYGEAYGGRTVISKLGIGAVSAGKSLRDTRI